MKLDVKALVREYIATEITAEIRKEGGLMTVRVLGEVLANKPGMAELVHTEALAVVRELLEGLK